MPSAKALLSQSRLCRSMPSVEEVAARAGSSPFCSRTRWSSHLPSLSLSRASTTRRSGSFGSFKAAPPKTYGLLSTTTGLASGSGFGSSVIFGGATGVTGLLSTTATGGFSGSTGFGASTAFGVSLITTTSGGRRVFCHTNQPAPARSAPPMRSAGQFVWLRRWARTGAGFFGVGGWLAMGKVAQDVFLTAMVKRTSLRSADCPPLYAFERILPRSRVSRSEGAVGDFFCLARDSGSPACTSSPPALPPSGPISRTQSASAITSG